MSLPRNRAIDILRFLGPLLITNSHMDIVYPNSLYATGGALGDAIFFFISGYTLNYTKKETFFRWFKRRLYRIYLVVFSVALVHEIFDFNQRSILDALLNGGGWFVKCLLIYYLFFFFLRQASNRTLLVLIFTVLAFSGLFLFNINDEFSIYGGTYFKWIHFFIPFLLGMLNFRVRDHVKITRQHFMYSILLFFIFYALLFISNSHGVTWVLSSLASIIVLSLLVNSFYVTSVYYSKTLTNTRAYRFMHFVGSIALEIYLVQEPLIGLISTESWILNVIATWLLILLFAYFIKVFSNIISKSEISKNVFRVI